MKTLLFLLFPISLFSQTGIIISKGLPGHSSIVIEGEHISFGNYSKQGIKRIFPSKGVFSYKKHIGRFYPVPIDVNYVDSIIGVNPDYKLLSFNCATFTSKAAHLPKFNTPNALRLHLEGKYRITIPKLVGFGWMTIAGVIWGGREALYADATVFERTFGVGEKSFFGSRQWERKYINNTHLNENGLKSPLKSQVFGNFGRDYWHTSKYVVFGVATAFTFGTGASKQKLRHKVYDLIIGSACFTAGSYFAYHGLRQ